MIPLGHLRVPSGRRLPAPPLMLGGLLVAAGAGLLAATPPGLAPAGQAGGTGILAMLCGGGGLVLLCRDGGRRALALALGAALLVALGGIVGAGLALPAGLTWGIGSMVLLGLALGTADERRPALLHPGCLALAGLGFGLGLAELRLASVGPFAYGCSAVACALASVCLPERRHRPADLAAVCGRMGILLSGLFGTWSTLTVDPWQARAPSERFIIRYLEQRQAEGARFDQDAFLRAFDCEDAEHAVVVGGGARALHLFVLRGQGGLDQRLIDLLAGAVAARRLSLCIHPVAGLDLVGDADWAAALQERPQAWAQWLAERTPPAGATARTPAAASGRSILAGTVRAMARFGITATPSAAVVDGGATPRLLALPALLAELQAAR